MGKKTTTWFNAFGESIREVEIERETEKMLFFKTPYGERRIKKDSSYDRYFRTRPEAVDHILRTTERRIKTAEESLDRMKSRFATFKELEALK